MNSIKLWGAIIPSPVSGFSNMDEKTKIALPLILILLLAAVSNLMIVPIITSGEYSDALIRTQISSMQEKGTQLSAEQIEAMSDQLTSDSMKTITVLSSVIGGLFGYALMLAVSIFILKLFTVIAKEKVSLKLLFRIIIFIALISIVQIILKNVITLTTDYGRFLSRVQTTSDLKYALTSPVSLAALFNPAKVGAVFYYLIDTFTDVFNWLYYGYLYAGLRGAAGLSKAKSLKITIISALVMVAIGLVMVMIV